MISFIKKETIEQEPAECETLYLELAGRLSNQDKRVISIGVLERDAKGKDGTISFQVVTFYTGGTCDVGTADLLEEEIDLVIKGLQDAKNRMMEYKK